MVDKQHFEFKKKLEEMKQSKGRGTELISLYVPPSRQVHEAMAYLRGESAESGNIKSRVTRNHVLDAIESLMSRLKLYKSVPLNGLVLFCGHVVSRNDQTEIKSFVIELPEPISMGKLLYRCDSEFYTEPLEELLADKDQYAIVVMDRSEATFGLLSGKRIILVDTYESMVPNKHAMGGQSQARYQRITEHEAHKFFKKIANTMEQEFLPKLDKLNGILIGGPGPTKDYFDKEGYLHHELRKKVIGTIDVGSTDEPGLREVVEKSGDLLKDVAFVKEKMFMKRFTDELVQQNAGLAEFGKLRVEEALKGGRVHLLLLSEALPLNEVNRLTALAEGFGTTVELISIETDPGAMLNKTFGGMAAVLRYRMN